MTQATPTVPVTEATCALHRVHAPRPTGYELHHVIPVAWQQAWQPTQPWPNAGHDPRGPLWDARTAVLCPTGHRSVHFYLAKIMHVVGQAPAMPWPTAVKVVTTGRRANRAEVAMAAEAIVRWENAGGSVAQLVARGLWGQS